MKITTVGLEPCPIGLEACGTAHFWARELVARGHQVRIMPPSYVKADVRRGKNDAADAEAIREAVTRPNMRFVPTRPRCPTLPSSVPGASSRLGWDWFPARTPAAARSGSAGYRSKATVTSGGFW